MAKKKGKFTMNAVSNNDKQLVGTYRLKRKGLKLPVKTEVYYTKPKLGSNPLTHKVQYTNGILEFKRKGLDLFRVAFPHNSDKPVLSGRGNGIFGVYADFEKSTSSKLSAIPPGQGNVDRVIKENINKLSQASKTFMALTESVSLKTLEQKAVKIMKELLKAK